MIAALLAVIPRARHTGLSLSVTPATILRWHRDLVKRRWAAKSRPKSPGRSRRHPAITRPALRTARDNEHLSWTQFLRSQAEAIIACDFITVDLLDGTEAYVMAAIEHATRRIHTLGATAHPTHAWAAQQTRNLLMDLDEPTGRIKFLIRDGDILYAPEIEHILSDAGISSSDQACGSCSRSHSRNTPSGFVSGGSGSKCMMSFRT